MNKHNNTPRLGPRWSYENEGILVKASFDMKSSGCMNYLQTAEKLSKHEHCLCSREEYKENKATQ